MTNQARYLNVSRAPVPLASGQVLGPGEDDFVDMGDNYDDLKVEQLQKLADDRDVTVVGTGVDGKVLKEDLVASLSANDPLAENRARVADGLLLKLDPQTETKETS